MPLRKRQVQRAVAAALLMGVFGPLVALVAWSTVVRGGAAEAAWERAVGTRLRCKVLAEGWRPDGPDALAVDGLTCTWDAGAGRVTLALEDFAAERYDAPRTAWAAGAARGRLDVEAIDLARALTVWNQHLGHQAPEPSLLGLNIEALTVHIRSDRLDVEETGRLQSSIPKEGWIRLSFETPVEDPQAERYVNASAEVKPGAPGGAVGSLDVFGKNLVTAEVTRALLKAVPPKGTDGGCHVEYRWTADGERPGDGFFVRTEDVDFAALTAGLPGGPLYARGTVTVASGRPKPEIDVDGIEITVRTPYDRHPEQNLIHAELLAWLETGLPPVETVAPLVDGYVGFDRLMMRARVSPNGTGHLAEGDRYVSRVWADLFGTDVNLLQADGRPFDAASLWAELGPRLLTPVKAGTLPE